MKKNYAALLLAVMLLLGGCAPDRWGGEAAQSAPVSLEEIPSYAGSPYVQINGNVPFFSQEEKERTDAFEIYSDLDALGRCGTAYANVCPALQPTEERGRIGQIRPSGWHTVKYNGYVEGNYLYNRCHLIAYQLTGENANEKNLITGTRYMNCDGQLPFEERVADHIEATGNHVLYRVTPLYEGEDLVASGVLMEAFSVEDHGALQFCVFCYNVQPGIVIDYATGDSRLADDGGADASQGYVLNLNTKKFHRPDCRSVAEIAQSNRLDRNCTREELLALGYEPCGNCRP